MRSGIDKGFGRKCIVLGAAVQPSAAVNEDKDGAFDRFVRKISSFSISVGP
jgi:hypothetical protein